MAGCHTVALILPRPAPQWLAFFFQLLSAATDSYVRVHDYWHGWQGWQSVRFSGSSSHDLFEVHLCRGSHFDELTQNPMGRGHLVGYISIYAILKFYWHALRRGHYVEVVAYSEDAVTGDVLSDLYVRIPFLSTSMYAELGSHFAVNGHIYVGSSHQLRPHCLRASTMHGITLPMLKSRALKLTDWDRLVSQLQSSMAQDLYEDVYSFARYVCVHHYNVDRPVVVGEPVPEERAILGAISGVLHGRIPDEVEAELATALAAGPAQLATARAAD